MADDTGPSERSLYAALVEADESAFQNVQELASIWGTVREDVRDLDGEFVDAYAVLGGSDFLVLFEAADRSTALQTAVAIERYGLDTETMELIPVERLGDLVDDI